MTPSGLTRRKVLKSVAATALTGLAGCLSGTDREGQESPEPNSPKPEVAFDAEVLRSFTNDHPAEIRLEFSNESDEILSYMPQESPGQEGMFIPVRGYHRDSDAELLVLREGANCASDTGTPSAIPETPTDESSTAETTGDGCWRPPCEELLLYSFVPNWEKFSPDEPMNDEYVVLDGFNEECLPEGTYDFTETGLIARGERTLDGGTESQSETYRIERRLTVSLDDAMDLTASAEAIIMSRDASDSDSTPQETPHPANETD